MRSFIVALVALATVSMAACSQQDQHDAVDKIVLEKTQYAELSGDTTKADIIASLSCEDGDSIINGKITALYNSTLVNGTQFYYALVAGDTIIEDGVVDHQGVVSYVRKPTAVNDFLGQELRYVAGTPTSEGVSLIRSNTITAQKC